MLIRPNSCRTRHCDPHRSDHPSCLSRVSNLLVEHGSEDAGRGARSQTVGEWLDSIKMGRYTELFMEGGYSTLDTVAQMTSE